MALDLCLLLIHRDLWNSQKWQILISNLQSLSGARVRRNCNVFNFVMENVLKGLPDKIRDQLSRHHTQMHFKSNEMYTFSLNHFQIARSGRWSIGCSFLSDFNFVSLFGDDVTFGKPGLLNSEQLLRSFCLWKLCELVSNIEEQLCIVLMYTGNLSIISPMDWDLVR
jgi:hypothetical protein